MKLRRKILAELVRFSALQIAVQAVTLVVGIIVLRHITLSEFGVYTLCIAFVSTLGVLCDNGIGVAVMELAAANVGNRSEMGRILHAALYVRLRVAALVAMCGFPILWYLLDRLNVAGVDMALLSAILFATFMISLQTSNFGTLLRLHGRIQSIQYIELIVACLRLVIIYVSLLVWPSPIIALGISGATSLLSVAMYRVQLRDIVESQRSDTEQRRKIWNSVRDILPATIYWCFSSNITVWLLGLKGGGAVLGQAGGLGRVSQGFQFLSSFILNYLVPRFAKAQRAADATQMLLWAISVLSLGLAALIALISFTPGVELVWFVLGKSFRGLQAELALVLGSSALSLIGGTLFQVCASRGWRLPAAISVLPNMVWLALAILAIDTSTLRGVLLVNFVATLPNILIFLILAVLRLRQLHANER